jgi:CheY-like chemotaxis protein
VIFSGVGDEEIALEAVREGAQDYIVKGALDPEYLARTLRYAIVRHSGFASRSADAAERGAVGTSATLQSSPPLVLHIAEGARDRSLVEEILKSEAVDLLQIPECEEGIFRAQTAHPAVILLDLALGDIQVSETLRSLKGDPATRSIPVIVTVDHFSPRVLDEIEEAGAAGHLSKPIERMKLLDELGRFIGPGLAMGR